MRLNPSPLHELAARLQVQTIFIGEDQSQRTIWDLKAYHNTCCKHADLDANVKAMKAYIVDISFLHRQVVNK